MRNTRKDIGKYLGSYTARGQLSEADSEGGAQARIRLFDGSFKTGHVIRELYIFPSDMSSSSAPDVVAKLSTSPNVDTGAATFLNFSDNREIGWGGAYGSTDSINGYVGVVDPDNLVVEDLWITARGSVEAADVNYMVVMDKYEITDALGAVSMARDRAADSTGEWRTP